MTLTRRLFTVLGLVALTSVASCTSFSSSRSPTMDKSGWITHCYGRFLIDFPPQAKINAGYDLWGIEIEGLEDTPTSLAAKIDQREIELKNQRHKTIQSSMFLRRVDLGEGATGLLSWSSDASTEMYRLDTYLVSKPEGRTYYRKGEISVDREHRGIEIATSLARNLRSRALNEIPTEPGFCIDRAYIAGDSFQSEDFDIGVTFPEHPRTFLSFRSSTGAEEDRLLDRVSGFLMGAAKMVAGIETLRKRERGGAIPADEYLLAGSAKGQRTYTFLWEAQGKDESINEPHLKVELSVEEADDDDDGKPAAPAFKSDKAALELWDAIIDSIRLRPVSAPGRDNNAGLPSPPNGPQRMANNPSVDDDYALEEFLAELKPKDNWMDDL
ncbi:T6SS immunity protein Tli4 family protein [Pseudomonas protegens]|uniref:T6SS immunity protein Tli4 family protein n=1 Tax=Pseudomonas protegens TaxID=380021 RepID=UPI002749F9C7|nr:T6SS immunity protein Tli4 family protein [Pseudomonas protegens]MDP9513233.1 T6SS immunity protein Tli4 family protein [Pseudomonas protegens]